MILFVQLPWRRLGSLSTLFLECSFGNIWKEDSGFLIRLAKFATHLKNVVVWKGIFPMWIREFTHSS